MKKWFLGILLPILVVVTIQVTGNQCLIQATSCQSKRQDYAQNLKKIEKMKRLIGNLQVKLKNSRQNPRKMTKIVMFLTNFQQKLRLQELKNENLKKQMARC